MTESDRTVTMEGRGVIDSSDLSWNDVRGTSPEYNGQQATPMPAPFEVETMEGTMRGEEGDVLIRGVKGELYPCDPDVFAETYELVGAVDGGDDE